MNGHRRKFLKTVSIALLPAMAGCADQSNTGDSNTEGSGESGGGETETAETGSMATETPADTDTPTPSETETATQSETATPTETETTTQTETATPTETTTSSDSSSLVINNAGIQAWEVTEDESGSVAPLNEENPTFSFEIGQRYAVENRGWSSHPFALRAEDDTPLLSQSADGEFNDDDAVNWQDNGDTFAFTFTEDVAAAVDYYICTVHPSMRGPVESA